jgi:hypothetical protein
MPLSVMSAKSISRPAAGAGERVHQPGVVLLVLREAVRGDEPVENLAHGQRQVRAVLVEHPLDVADQTLGLGVRRPVVVPAAPAFEHVGCSRDVRAPAHGFLPRG